MLLAHPHLRRALIALTLATLFLALATEFLAFSWFSPVTLTPSPHQRFISLSRGELRLGTRGTGGFFSRYVPPPGPRLSRPARVASDEPTRFFLPRTLSRLQTRGLTIPIHTIAVLLLMLIAVSCCRRRTKIGHCPSCNYDLGGVPSATCPECGRASPS